jgi:hypothetical protein
VAAEKHPLWELFYAAERDLRAGLAKMTELGRELSNTTLPEPTDLDCPVCGLRTKGPRTLAEHLYLSHDGTVPETWERADQLAD